MEERRKLSRRYLIHPVRVLDPDSNDLIGFVENITDEGIMLRTGRLFHTTILYRFKMLLSEDIHETGHFEFSAECKWWDKDIYTGSYHAGFCFKNVTFEGHQVLNKIMDRVCYDENHSEKHLIPKVLGRNFVWDSQRCVKQSHML